MKRLLKNKRPLAFFACLALVCCAFVAGLLAAQGSDTRLLAADDVRNALASVQERCSLGDNRPVYLRCIRQELMVFIVQYRLRPVMDSLEQVFMASAGTEGKEMVSCHDVAHIAGEAGAEILGSAGAALSACTRACGFGCFHGATTAGLKRDLNAIHHLSNLCAPFAASSFPGQDLTACRHGVGHGLADYASRDVEKAIPLCDGFDAQIGREECATGVLMELIDAPTLDRQRVELPANIIDFCQKLPGVYNEVCSRSAGGYEYRRSKDIKKAFKTCDTLSGQLRTQCAVAIGADLHFILQGDPAAINNQCAAGSAVSVPACIEGALISGFVTDPSGALNITLCKSVHTSLQEGCFSFIGRSIEQLSNTQERQRICTALSAQEAAACLKNLP